MGWLQEKYTRQYFLPEPGQEYGVEGFDAFLAGSVYQPVLGILSRVDWAGKAVLEIGPGRGEALRHVLKGGASSAVGVEFSEPAVEITRETLEPWADQVAVLWQDALSSVFGKGSFDAVLAFDVIEHIPDQEWREIEKRIVQWLKPGGLFLWHTPHYVDKVTPTPSDVAPETAGMHCNKQDWDGMTARLKSIGLVQRSPHSHRVGDAAGPLFFVWQKPATPRKTMPEPFWQTPAGLRHIVPPGCPQPEGFDVHAELYGLTKLDSVLEFGCGVGRLSKAFLSSKYLGVDVSLGALNEAQNRNPNYAFLHYVGGRLPQANTVFAWTVLLHVSDDEIEETVRNLVQAANGQVVIGEIMGRSWRREGDPPVFNREPEEYAELLKGAGLLGGINQYTKPCVRYPDSHYTILVGTK